jgi:hypothetical protein
MDTIYFNIMDTIYSIIGFIKNKYYGNTNNLTDYNTNNPTECNITECNKIVELPFYKDSYYTYKEQQLLQDSFK